MNENITIHETDAIPACDECACCDEELFEVDGRLLCADCLERLGYVRCSECGAWLDSDCADFAVYKDDIICGDCADRMNLVRCDECGEYHHSNEMVQVDGGWRHDDWNLCPTCLETLLESDRVFFCEDCNEYYQTRWVDRYNTASGETVCESCRENYYSYCDDCGELFNTDNVSWFDDEDDGELCLCESCYDARANRQRHANRVHNYSYKPYPIFYGLDHDGDPRTNDPLTFGFENEIDKGSDRAGCSNEIYDAFGDDVLYMKEDSSVDFEIVTHPRTLDSYLHDFDFDTLCSIPQKYDYKSHDAGTCGFHIHVGRKQLGSTEANRRFVISKIVLLMYKHWASLVKFSRRKDIQLDRWAAAPKLNFRTKTTVYDASTLLETVRQQYLDDYNRYRALNLCNSGTIEFRLWRGSLKPVTLKATLQLTSNIVRFAMDHALSDVVNSTWEDLVNYETCPELTEYLASLNLETGLDTKEIPFNNELPKATTTYKVGDYVKIVDCDSLVDKQMIGTCGTIMGFNRNDLCNRTEIALRIDMDTFDEYGTIICLHNCDGLTPSRMGYWVDEDVIEPAVKQLKVGDRVAFTPNVFDAPEMDGRLAGYGTVCSTDDGSFIGVSIDDFTAGHNLGGMIPADRDQRSGWLFDRNTLRPVSNM